MSFLIVWERVISLWWSALALFNANVPVDEIAWSTPWSVQSSLSWNFEHCALVVPLSRNTVSYLETKEVNAFELIPTIPTYIIHMKLKWPSQKVFLISDNCCSWDRVEMWKAARYSCIVKWRKLTEVVFPAPPLT